MERIILVGLNHKTAPVPIRERVAFSPGHLGEALEALSDRIPHGIILSTCNRTEVYATSNGHPSFDGVFEFLGAHSGIPVKELSPYLYTLDEGDAVRHLFRVAAGLESMIVGEYEVLGQVRQALEEAKAGGLIASPLLELFQQAVGVGRRVREETDISRNAASVSSAAVALAKSHFGNLKRCQVLLVGAGEAGALVAKALVKIGTCQVTVTNRSYTKAAALASEVGGTAVPLHQLGEALGRADILISCSGAPHYIIEPEAIRQAVGARSSQPILLIDIAVPRDIDPAVRDVEGVILHDIDDLSSVVKANRELREREADKAAAIIEDEVSRFIDWRNSRDMAPMIKALVGKAEEIRTTQLARTLEEIPGLSAEDRERLDAMTRAIVKKLLHSPISCLKKYNGNHIEVARKVFGLED
ncbi:MAG: glutamyl-tRNA reductase [Dehalococcoidia bacterium]|nr:MAG: glutamyl-tRNA reductase [Dehalococcoidia bacterium]